jgi:ABC-2 type transport system ATP-binding protein
MSEVVLETRELTRTFSGRGGCAGISLKVEAGRVYSLLGPNGAGKSTFIKTMVGLLPPESGAAWIAGRTITGREARKHCGYLPEQFRYYEWLTAGELLKAFAHLHGNPGGADDRHVRGTLEGVGLGGAADKRVGSFSKGMQQRLGLATALLNDPEVLFLDEPTSALDPIGRRDVREIIQALKRRGRTVFLNSHLLSEVEMVSDEVGFIKAGRLLLSAPLHQLLKATHKVELRLGAAAPEAPPENLAGIVDGWSARGSELVVTIKGGAGVPQVVRTLAASGVDIYQVTALQTTLEDMFLRLVGEEAAE